MNQSHHIYPQILLETFQNLETVWRIGSFLRFGSGMPYFLTIQIKI
jgi:hypothetical protein